MTRAFRQADVERALEQKRPPASLPRARCAGQGSQLAGSLGLVFQNALPPRRRIKRRERRTLARLAGLGGW